MSFTARADEGWYPIRADDGSIIANHRVPENIENLIERLPGITVAGNPRGTITLNEFYDLNCPYCRKASADIDRLLRSFKELRLVLVPFPVLGIPSIQAGKVELAVQQHTSPQAFYEFHRKTMAVRGVMDGNRAFAVAQAMGLDDAKVAKAAIPARRRWKASSGRSSAATKWCAKTGRKQSRCHPEALSGWCPAA